MNERTYTDKDLKDFLRALDKANVDVSDWEAEFIESNLETNAFTFKQRESIKKMIDRFGKRIGWL